MSDSSPHRILLLGLPETGKTTFLAALWHIVQDPAIGSSLQFERLDGDSKYLNQISQAWLECTPVARNPLDSESVAQMTLKDNHGGQLMTLLFPDLSGESFSLQWSNRQFNKTYDQSLRQASGGMLFIHPGRVKKPMRIDTAEPLVEEASKGVPSAPADARAVPAAEPWDADKSPTQVKLVELLQFISSRDYFRPPFRLAVLISAWDTIAQLGQTPRAWLAKQLPLLDQFLQSNEDVFHAIVYGVSAQGGDYSAAKNLELLRKSPATRVQLVGDGVKNAHDLTEPLRCLMS